MSNNGRTLSLLGAGALVAGALLPWAEITAPFVGTVSVPGYRGDGLLTGGIGLLLLLGALASQGKPGKRYSIAIAIFGLLTLLLTIPKIFAIGDIEATSAIAGVGVGLWVSIVGGIMSVAGGMTRLPAAPVVAAPVPPVIVAPVPEPVKPE